METSAPAMMHSAAAARSSSLPYEILSTIQRGGMGELFLARRRGDSSAAPVVLKRLLPNFLEDPTYREMFLQEARIMSSLAHPNIVRVLESPELEGLPCLVMEYVDGRNVQQVLRQCRELRVRLPPRVAMYVVLEVLQGLAYAHDFCVGGRSLGLVHRDVTPGNVLISFEGAVKITDFGIAKSKMLNKSTTVGVVKGTTRYLSPEQVRGREVSHRSDLFSAAVVLVEMLTGKCLFDRGAVPPTLFAIVSGERPAIADILPFTAPALAGVLERALDIQPDGRFASATEFAEALTQAVGGAAAVASTQEVSAYLCDLFGGRGDRDYAQHTPSEDVSPLDALYLSYLLEVPEAKQCRANDSQPVIRPEDFARAHAHLDRSGPAGAAPLDAAQFSGATFSQDLHTPLQGTAPPPPPRFPPDAVLIRETPPPFDRPLFTPPEEAPDAAAGLLARVPSAKMEAAVPTPAARQLRDAGDRVVTEIAPGLGDQRHITSVVQKTAGVTDAGAVPAPAEAAPRVAATSDLIGPSHRPRARTVGRDVFMVAFGVFLGVVVSVGLLRFGAEWGQWAEWLKIP